jgi:hypothetical protein
MALDFDVEKVSGAGNAGVVVANGLLAFPGGFSERAMDELGGESAKVVFDAALILRSGRNDFGGENQALAID